MKQIVIATNNQGKIREMKTILSNILDSVEFKTLKDLSITFDVEEDVDTIEGNAIKKAKEYYELTKIPCIADDSGLCIDAFDGWPGVKTKRFIGVLSDEHRNSYIVDKMKSIKEREKRKAKHLCSIAYYDGDKIIIANGETNGYIVNPRGDNGFGFDTIFELENGKTQAELSEEEKNQLSARNKALVIFKKKLKTLA